MGKGYMKLPEAYCRAGIASKIWVAIILAALSFLYIVSYNNTMPDAFTQYSFEKKNKITLIFIPGFSGGLEVDIISSIVEHFSNKKSFDVLGLNLLYAKDGVDEFKISQKILVDTLLYFSQNFPDKHIHLIGKSLGGSLSLFNLQKLSVKSLTILGCSVVLGWPQRLSLLSSASPTIPDYKTEWQPIFKSVSTPVTILTGENDDLTDNQFLIDSTEENRFVDVKILPGANHNLENVNTNTLYSDVCIETIQGQIR
jgi:pimeloyl-ACP methyl ester carboxylesterase